MRHLNTIAEINDWVIHPDTSENSPNHYGRITSIEKRKGSNKVYRVKYRDLEECVTDKYIKKQVIKGIKITDFDQLTEGKEYYIYNLQFDCLNKAVLISKDFTGMNRDIVYFQFNRHITKPISKPEMIKQLTSNKMVYDLFAFWSWELKYNEIIEA